MKQFLLSVMSLFTPTLQVFSTSTNCFLSRHLESRKGMFLKGHEMVAFQKISLVRCASLCFLKHHEHCRSFSYNRQGQFCQLNTRNQRDVPADLLAKPNFNFYQAKWFSTKFFDGYQGTHCLDKGPCGDKMIDFYGNHCYEVRDRDNQTYLDARAKCRNKHGHLAMFKMSAERSVVERAMSKVRQFDSLWIGLEDLDRDDVYRWVDGSVQPRGPPWRSKQPDNTANAQYPEERCAAVEHCRPGEFQYNDVPCPLKWPYICQYDTWMYQNW